MAKSDAESRFLHTLFLGNYRCRGRILAMPSRIVMRRRRVRKRRKAPLPQAKRVMQRSRNIRIRSTAVSPGPAGISTPDGSSPADRAPNNRRCRGNGSWPVGALKLASNSRAIVAHPCLLRRHQRTVAIYGGPGVSGTIGIDRFDAASSRSPSMSLPSLVVTRRRRPASAAGPPSRYARARTCARTVPALAASGPRSGHARLRKRTPNLRRPGLSATRA